MRRFGSIGATMLGASLVMGCHSDEPVWALQHAEVTLSGDSLIGYQTWEFYSKKWGRSQNEKFHVCARVQVVEGSLAESMKGCQDCDAVYDISLTELETDCDGDVGTSNSFRSASHFGLGPIEGELSEENPHEAAEQGWYVSWDSVELEAVGYAWPSEGEQSSGDTGIIEEGSETLVLWPGYAWQL